MIKRLNEVDGNTYDTTSEYEAAWNKALKIISRACNRFGYDVRVSSESTEDYKYIKLYSRYGAGVILEMYAPYEEALVRLDCTDCIERYAYGKSEGQCKATLERAKDFRQALTKGIELATVMESYFGEL